MSIPPRRINDDGSSDNNESMSLINQERKVLVNKSDTSKQIDEIIGTFKEKSDKELSRIDSQIEKITASAEVRLTRNGKTMSENYQSYLGKINDIHNDMANASTRAEANEIDETIKTYKKIIKTTKNLTRSEKKEIRGIIAETEEASKIVRNQKLTRGKLFIESVKDNLPDIAGLTAAIIGDNIAVAFAGGVIGDWRRKKKEAKAQEIEKRRNLWKDERDTSISESVDLRRDRDDEIIRRKNVGGFSNIFTNRAKENSDDFTQPIERESSSMVQNQIDNDTPDVNSSTFFENLQKTLIDSVREGIVLGMQVKEGSKFKTSNKRFEEDSKLKREKFDNKGKPSSIMAEGVNKELVKANEIAMDTNEAIKESGKEEEYQSFKELSKSIWQWTSMLFGLASKNEKTTTSWLMKVFGRFGAREEGIKKFFDFFRGSEEKWQHDIVGINTDQLRVLEAIYRILGGKDEDHGDHSSPSPTDPDRPLLGGPYSPTPDEHKSFKDKVRDAAYDIKESLYDVKKKHPEAYGDIKGGLQKIYTKGESLSGRVKSSIKDRLFGRTGEMFGTGSTTVNISRKSLKSMGRMFSSQKNNNIDLNGLLKKGGKDKTGLIGSIGNAVKPLLLDTVIGAGAGGLTSAGAGGVGAYALNKILPKGATIAEETVEAGAKSGFFAKLLSKIPGKGRLGGMALAAASAWGTKKFLDSTGVIGNKGSIQNSIASGAVGGTVGAVTETGLGGKLLAKGLGAGSVLLEKIGIKGASKLGGSALSKAIPGIGLAVGGYFAADRAMKGDFVGAGMEALAGIVGLFPQFGGTIASLGISAALLAKDLSEEGKVSPSLTMDETNPIINAKIMRNKEMENNYDTIKEKNNADTAKIMANSVSNAVTNIGGSSTTINMAVSPYDLDRGTNLLSNSLSA